MITIKNGDKIIRENFELSFSRIKHMDKTPKHFIHELNEQKDPSYEMSLGKALHCFLLESEEKMLEKFHFEEINGRTKEGKAKKEELAKLGKEILDPSDLSTIKEMANEILSIPAVAFAIAKKENCEKEIHFNFNDLPFKGFLDCHTDSFILDIKTTSQIDRFEDDIDYQHYDAQLCLYRQGLAQKRNGELLPILIVAIESKPPFTSRVIQLQAESIALGEAKLMKWTNKIKECMAKNSWSGYERKVEQYYPKKWRMEKYITSEGL